METRAVGRGAPIRRRAAVRAVLASAVMPMALTAPGLAKAAGRAGVVKSGVKVEVKTFCTPPATSAVRPLAMLNYVFHAGDGSNRLFAADSRGKIWQIDTAGRARLFLDLKAIRGSALFEDGNPKHLGLRSFAFHPDFARSGRAGYRKFFTVNTERVASASPGTPVLGDPTLSNSHHDVIAEWTVAADGTVITTSRREIVRIRQFYRIHNTDTVIFDPNLAPGASGYGLMYFGVGDGMNSPRHLDPHDQAQNLARPLGKILRINPLAKSGKSYTIPSSNPFPGQSGGKSEVYAYGLRHPEFLCFDETGSGKFICADIGQDTWEEINLIQSGKNYGWPEREGLQVTNRFDSSILYPLPADDAKYHYTYPVAQYDHSVGFAIAGGWVYRGSKIPALRGHYVFGDIVNGRVFHVPVSSLQPGALAEIKELTLTVGGAATTMRKLVGTTKRVDLRLGQDEAGEIYLSSKQDGVIRKLAPA
ncbi:MAG: PQQ-dependent sugar dehydrogenase [Geminicoccaceae bacterium]